MEKSKFIFGTSTKDVVDQMKKDSSTINSTGTETERFVKQKQLMKKPKMKKGQNVRKKIT